jgi:hypothetical protein
MIGGNGSGTTEYPKPIVFPNPPPAPAPGIQKHLSSQIARIKARLNYNEAIGKDLGVIAIPDNVEHGVPEFWLTVEMGLDVTQMRIDFTSARTGSIGRLATSSAGSCGFCPQSWRLQLG